MSHFRRKKKTMEAKGGVFVVDISNSLKINDFHWPCIAMGVHMRMEVEFDGCMMYYSTETGGGGGLILDTPCSVKHESHT